MSTLIQTDLIKHTLQNHMKTMVYQGPIPNHTTLCCHITQYHTTSHTTTTYHVIGRWKCPRAGLGGANRPLRARQILRWLNSTVRWNPKQPKLCWQKNRKIEPSGLCFKAILAKRQNINYIQVQATLLPWYEKELGVRRCGQEDSRQSAQGRKQGWGVKSWKVGGKTKRSDGEIPRRVRSGRSKQDVSIQDLRQAQCEGRAHGMAPGTWHRIWGEEGGYLKTKQFWNDFIYSYWSFWIFSQSRMLQPCLSTSYCNRW